MKCEVADCQNDVIHLYSDVEKQPHGNLCMKHRLDAVISSATVRGSCNTCGRKGEDMVNKLFQENLGLWKYIDLLEARLDKLAKYLGVEDEYIDSIGPLFDAIDALKLHKSLREAEYTLEEDERHF